MFLLTLCVPEVIAAQTNNEIFLRMVGPEAAMDKAVTAKVLQSEPGEKLAVDSDGDGRIDTLYFIDIDDRHQNERSPLLVKIVDEDGDMYMTGEGDFDSDLYVADWYGDGTIDRVIDYIDLDHDNDVDEQVLYQWSDMRHFLAQSENYGGKAYCAVWAKDYGDDNRLWYDINYEYNQRTTQWLTDFNGDEMFVYAFFYDYVENIFNPGFENPFAFYDLDDDTYSEEVVRLGAAGFKANTLRYSMDLDNDTQGSNHHDYDFSVSAIGPVDYNAEKCMTLNLRGIETGPVITWEHVRRIAKEGDWAKIHLTWDENDNNIDPVEGRQHNERWEGIISFGNEYIRQVGGPSCGPYNKRNEVDTDGSGDFRFYYSTVDRRLHLYGAEVGWIRADYDYDDQMDMEITMKDGDGNGFFDTWKYDVDADGTFDRVFYLVDDTCTLYPFEYQTLHEVYVPSLEKSVKDNQQLIDVLREVLAKIHGTDFKIDEIEDYFRSSLVTDYDRGYGLGEKIKNSLEGSRYYGDLIRERYWQLFAGSDTAGFSKFPDIKRAYERGDFTRAADLLEDNVPGYKASSRHGSFPKRFTIELTNPADLYLEHHPVVLDIETIRKNVPGFNPRSFEIVEAERRIDWRGIPSQMDDLHGDTKPDELVFVRSLKPLSTTTLHCYYTPEGSSDNAYPQKTDTHRDWLDLKANIGWESNLCAYRMYYGQIDFFGKRLDGLRLKNPGPNYHSVSDWGMDVLHVGRSSGLGGISIWEDDERIPVMNPAGEGTVQIERTILSSGPVRSLVRIDFTNIHSAKGEYTVSLLMSAFADNRFSRQDITITATAGDSVVYSPGVTKLPNDTFHIDTGSGVLTNFGISDNEIKDIGMGIIFKPGEYTGYSESETDRYVRLKIPAGKQCTHWIIGGWRKGFMSPVAPSAKDWADSVEELARRLCVPVGIRYYED